MLNVFIADDHALFAGVLEQVLQAEPDFHLLGTATSPAQLREVLGQQQPDLLLLDLYFGDEVRDLTFAREVQKRYPRLKIVILSSETRKIGLIQDAYASGLAGYLSKSISLDELIRDLKKVALGERVFSSDVMQTVFSRSGQPLPRLTPMEANILRCLGMGMKRASICEEIGIKSTNTYDTHVQHLKEKFGAESTNDLLRKAAEWGYV